VGDPILTSQSIWVEDAEPVSAIKTSKRIGIKYVGEEWENKPWRFYVDSKKHQNYVLS
jgi:3-methyladenine DNA glycosylase Mpg